VVRKKVEGFYAVGRIEIDHTVETGFGNPVNDGVLGIDLADEIAGGVNDAYAVSGVNVPQHEVLYEGAFAGTGIAGDIEALGTLGVGEKMGVLGAERLTRRIRRRMAEERLALSGEWRSNVVEERRF
jgi:hypothetical protein